MSSAEAPLSIFNGSGERNSFKIHYLKPVIAVLWKKKKNQQGMLSLNCRVK